MALSCKVRQLEHPFVKWRASSIQDPVEKLTFLRNEALSERGPQGRFWLRKLMLGGVVVLGFSILTPTPAVVSDVSPLTAGAGLFPGRQGSPVNFTDVWPVEESETHQIYSNGLRVDNTHQIANSRRFFQALDRNSGMQPAPDWRSEPVGIVYHTTESSMAPFEAAQNRNLLRLSLGLLAALRDNRSYNFVIDRFGRVFRIVDESDAANHAGNSVWADESHAYLNLNNSFVAVAFEARASGINSAQIHAGRMLTEMLRGKYKIAAENCVTHAQVSVNPSNMRIGYHTDWASGFPFQSLGLPDNYDAPPASVAEFGFGYDDAFRKAMGNKVWKGLSHAELQLERDAAVRQQPPADYRKSLQERYRKLFSQLKLTGALEEPTAENAN